MSSTARSFETALAELVGAESPSDERRGRGAGPGRAGRIGPRRGGRRGDGPSDPETAGGPWPGTAGTPTTRARVLLLGHVDTVWPRGTLAERPFAVTGRAGVRARRLRHEGRAGGGRRTRSAALGRDVPVSLVVTGDEEVGSPGSREAIAEHASRCQASLVLEGAGPGRRAEVSPQGLVGLHLRLRGVAAHAGLEPGARPQRPGPAGDLVRAGGGARRTRLPAVSVTPDHAPSPAGPSTPSPTAPSCRSTYASRRPPTRRASTGPCAGSAGTDESGVEVTLGGGIDRPPMEQEATAALLDRVGHARRRRVAAGATARRRRGNLRRQPHRRRRGSDPGRPRRRRGRRARRPRVGRHWRRRDTASRPRQRTGRTPWSADPLPPPDQQEAVMDPTKPGRRLDFEEDPRYARRQPRGLVGDRLLGASSPSW